MAPLAVLLIWFFPGSVFCLHQGIDHYRGVNIPQIVIFDWDVPHWIIYALVMLLGPVILLALLIDMVRRG